MNLANMFVTQRKLDEHIMDQHPELRGQNNLDWKILTLQVELGECANEWRGFKKWSNDQEPRTWYPNENDICETCKGNPIFYENNKIVGQCEECDGCGVHFHNPLLEEYVDCLHFILSIGLELGFEDDCEPFLVKEPSTMDFFNIVYTTISKFRVCGGRYHKHYYYCELLSQFLGLGKSLGFTWEQIEQAYLDKNKVNHKRQESGY